MPRRIRRASAAALVVAVVAIALAPARGQQVDLLDVPAPASAIYLPRQYPIRFEHEKHVVDIDCLVCHVEARASTASAESLLPAMAVCGECHPQAADTEDPDACAFCHPDYRPTWPDGAGLMAVRDPRFPLTGPRPLVPLRSNLVFSHQRHAESECAHCHDADAALPRMAVCTDCHEEREAANACATCHPTGEDGRLVTELPGDDVTPTVVLRPRDHNADWNASHRVAAGANAEACFVCHSEADCLACHDGRLATSSLHPPGFINQHAYLARRDQANCGSCHTSSTFCVDCHALSGVTAEEEHRPPLGYELHPPGWLEDGGGAHAYEAQLNMQSCASCHAESDCADCHAQVNPHDSAFFSRCDALLNANPQVCLRCHASTSDLADRCR